MQVTESEDLWASSENSKDCAVAFLIVSRGYEVEKVEDDTWKKDLEK
ncbi:MAG: hypothetical protein ACXADO_00675 [Candidatus Thorarchaeota archaeon]|jgi:hypothetical protein